MKHTPGPWVSGPELEDVISGAERIRQVIQSASDQFTMQPHVANVAGLNQSNEEIEANARLIAAAPDVLFELKQLLAWYAALPEPGLVPLGLAPILRGAKSIIKKVEGDS